MQCTHMYTPSIVIKIDLGHRQESHHVVHIIFLAAADTRDTGYPGYGIPGRPSGSHLRGLLENPLKVRQFSHLKPSIELGNFPAGDLGVDWNLFHDIFMFFKQQKW